MTEGQKLHYLSMAAVMVPNPIDDSTLMMNYNSLFEDTEAEKRRDLLLDKLRRRLRIWNKIINISLGIFGTVCVLLGLYTVVYYLYKHNILDDLTAISLGGLSSQLIIVVWVIVNDLKLVKDKRLLW